MREDDHLKISELQEKIHQNAIDKGFWEYERPLHELLSLVCAEVFEAIEAAKNMDMENFAEELADICMVTMDIAESQKIDIEKEIIKKYNFNKSRPYKHGKSLLNSYFSPTLES